MSFSNPTEFRQRIEDLIDENGIADIGGITVTREELEGAAEEIIGVMVDAYLNQTPAPSCASLIGRILLNEFENQLST